MMVRSLAVAVLCQALAWGQTAESIAKQLESIARQRESVRRQAAVPAAAPPSCDTVPEELRAPLLERAANAQQLPAKLLRAMVEQESAFRPCAVSRKGAQGLMQLMPVTAEELGVEDPFDAAANLAAGAKYLRQLLEKHKGDLRLSLAAYNAGPAAVEQAGGIPPVPETRDYVDAIVAKMGVTQIDLPEIPPPKPIGN